MNFRPSRIIGLAVGIKSFLLAEVTARPGSRPVIQRLAEFPFPEGLTLNHLPELGQALAKFLRSEKFSTRDVVIGLPARRLLTRRKELPPAAAAAAAATLRLQAESEFPAGVGAAGEPDSLSVDFVGKTSTTKTTDVLLVATSGSFIEQCRGIAKAAGLRIRGITAASVALGRVSNPPPDADSLMVSFAAGTAELMVQHGSVPAQLRHLAITSPGSLDSLGVLVGEIRRTIASLHQNGFPGGGGLTLALWDDSAAAGTGKLLAQRLNIPVHSLQLESLAVAPASVPASSHVNAFAPAVAVALIAMDSAGLPVDFLHSRLAPPKQSSNKRPLSIAISIAVVIVLAIAAGVVDLNLKQRQLDDLGDQRRKIADEAATARIEFDRLKEARSWTTRKPRYVTCVRDLTTLFPDEGSIWATSLSLSSDNKGILTGKSAGELQVRALKDKLLASKMFLDPRITEVRDSPRTAAGGATTEEKSFSISFIYRAPE